MTPEELRRILESHEGPRLEFKRAAHRFDFDELVRYCVAIANEGGGRIVLGVSDSRPRQVAGTTALPEPGQTEASIFQRIGHHVSIDEVTDEERHRVVVVTVPGRLPGSAWSDRGAYWMRAGEALVPMSDERLKAIHAEVAPDFSAEICHGSGLADLDRAAIREFRQRWARRETNARIEARTDEEVLRSAELMRDGVPTVAALLLFATREALTRFIPRGEIVFEYRSSEAAGPAQDRAEYREGFLLYQDRLWDRINQRNDRQSFQDGLFRVEIPTFDEASIREAILNAFCHRDYRTGGSVFVRQFSRRLEVASPGGFPPGITPENIIDEQNPRNRRLAEALARCGLIERAGQGLNLMFEKAIRQSKPLPDFAGTTAHSVRLTLHGQMMNPRFLAFLERVGDQTLASFDTRDMLVLDHLQRDERVPFWLVDRLARLVHVGVVESIGRGRGTQYLLSRRFAAALGQRAAYTRRRGLDREQNKELLLRHLREDGGEGSPMSELHQVVPALSREQVKHLMDELRREGRVRVAGTRRWARWFTV